MRRPIPQQRKHQRQRGPSGAEQERKTWVFYLVPVQRLTIESAQEIIQVTLGQNKSRRLHTPDPRRMVELVDGLIDRFQIFCFIEDIPMLAEMGEFFTKSAHLAGTLRENLEQLTTEWGLGYFYLAAQNRVHTLDQEAVWTKLQSVIGELADVRKYADIGLAEIAEAERRAGSSQPPDNRWIVDSEVTPKRWIYVHAIPILYEELFKHDYRPAAQYERSPSLRFAIELIKTTRLPEAKASNLADASRDRLSRGGSTTF